VVDVTDKITQLEYEIEENVQRQDFTGDEIILAARELNRLKNPGFLQKIRDAVVSFFKKLFKVPV
jgi:ParB family chromosome partitioning protein